MLLSYLATVGVDILGVYTLERPQVVPGTTGAYADHLLLRQVGAEPFRGLVALVHDCARVKPSSLNPLALRLAPSSPSSV